MAGCKFRSDGVSACNATGGQPWVADNVSNAEALVRVELEHAGDQVLEVGRVEALSLAGRVGVGLPEEIASVGGQQLVVVVLLIGHAEGWVTRVEDEENHTEGEEVDDLTLVGLLLENLRSHVAWRADHGLVGS